MIGYQCVCACMCLQETRWNVPSVLHPPEDLLIFQQPGVEQHTHLCSPAQPGSFTEGAVWCSPNPKLPSKRGKHINKKCLIYWWPYDFCKLSNSCWWESGCRWPDQVPHWIVIPAHSGPEIREQQGMHTIFDTKHVGRIIMIAKQISYYSIQ